MGAGTTACDVGATARPSRAVRRKGRERGARRGGRVGRFTPCRASMANTSCWNVTDLFQRALQKEDLE